MSFLFLFGFKAVVEAGELNEAYLFCWALFAIADALWMRLLCGK